MVREIGIVLGILNVLNRFLNKLLVIFFAVWFLFVHLLIGKNCGYRYNFFENNVPIIIVR